MFIYIIQYISCFLVLHILYNTRVWCVLDVNKSKLSPVLQHAKIVVWEQAKCQTVYSSRLTSSMICAGYENGQIDACKVCHTLLETRQRKLLQVRFLKLYTSGQLCSCFKDFLLRVLQLIMPPSMKCAVGSSCRQNNPQDGLTWRICNWVNSPP